MFRVGALLRFGSIAALIFHTIACMGGCIGCDTKPKLKEKNSPWEASKVAISDGFWTSSFCEMDNPTLQSYGSISPPSMLTQFHDAHGAGSQPTEFINQGLLLWNQNRQNWIGNRKPEMLAQHLSEPKISWNSTYDSLLSSNKRFREPIPLAEMVDFLVDIWEQEEMYD